MSIMRYETRQTENGQRAKYGDSYYTFIIEFENELDATKENVFEIGQTLYKCELPYATWKLENTNADNHFRNYYSISKINDTTYKYMVVYQSTH